MKRVKIAAAKTSHRIVSPKRPFASIRRRRYRPARWASSSTDLLLEERQAR